MSKTHEHYHGAAHHHERAAHEFKEAAKYHQSEEHEKAAHHAYLAHAHSEHAVRHDIAAARLRVGRFDGLVTSGVEETEDKKAAA
jgi:hypothetical protein